MVTSEAYPHSAELPPARARSQRRPDPGLDQPVCGGRGLRLLAHLDRRVALGDRGHDAAGTPEVLDCRPQRVVRPPFARGDDQHPSAALAQVGGDGPPVPQARDDDVGTRLGQDGTDRGPVRRRQHDPGEVVRRPERRRREAHVAGRRHPTGHRQRRPQAERLVPGRGRRPAVGPYLHAPVRGHADRRRERQHVDHHGHVALRRELRRTGGAPLQPDVHLRMLGAPPRRRRRVAAATTQTCLRSRRDNSDTGSNYSDMSDLWGTGGISCPGSAGVARSRWTRRGRGPAARRSSRRPASCTGPPAPTRSCPSRRRPGPAAPPPRRRAT